MRVSTKYLPYVSAKYLPILSKYKSNRLLLLLMLIFPNACVCVSALNKFQYALGCVVSYRYIGSDTGFDFVKLVVAVTLRENERETARAQKLE